MKILAIETSCDETAIALIEGTMEKNVAKGRILAHLLSSQTDIHKAYGGVVPSIAKREHQKMLIPVLEEVFKKAGVSPAPVPRLSKGLPEKIKFLLAREPDLQKQTVSFLRTYSRPPVDAVAVTVGPGLEPALWVGINLAKTLSFAWNVPIIPVNHMEGHLYSPFIRGRRFNSNRVQFPAVALLVSGGHTELVAAKDLTNYQKLGMTRDDAAGEAFDKVARMLDLPYPGGPEISRLANRKLPKNAPLVSLPRPMIDSADYDFSFSGLKTAVLYALKNFPEVTDAVRVAVAKEFQAAVIETLSEKTMRAAEEYNAVSILLGGGVAANKSLRDTLSSRARESGKNLFLPEAELTTDNAAMIAVSGLINYPRQTTVLDNIAASGTMSL